MFFSEGKLKKKNHDPSFSQNVSEKKAYNKSGGRCSEVSHSHYISIHFSTLNEHDKI